jgi:ferredoxin-like protein FixX
LESPDRPENIISEDLVTRCPLSIYNKKKSRFMVSSSALVTVKSCRVDTH